MICRYCEQELVEVDNPMRREVRHRRGTEELCPLYTMSAEDYAAEREARLAELEN